MKQKLLFPRLENYIRSVINVGVTDLIPVNPIGVHQKEIESTHKTTLPALFEKISPVAV